MYKHQCLGLERVGIVGTCVSNCRYFDDLTF